MATCDVLIRCGFQPDSALISDLSPALSFDFGNFKLEVIHALNLQFVKTFQFGGTLSTHRVIRMVEFEMPEYVESFEQGVAWIAWNLDNGRKFDAKQSPDWLDIGRQNIHLLPWKREFAAWKARPKCTVARDWMRLVLKAIAELLNKGTAESQFTLSFDGNVLRISLGGEVIATSASGLAWTCAYSVPASSMKRLPRRLSSKQVEISIWKSELQIANRRYEGIVPVAK